MKNLQNKIRWILREKYSGKENKGIDKDIKRLKAGEPLDYIIGFADFLGCRIDLSKRPLIPRVETEFWVEKAIKQISHNYHGRKNYGIRVLDMFAGSGCIGVAVLKHIPNAKVVFAEKDKKLLGQIKINCKNNDISKNRYKIIHSNIFEKVAGKYDCIFANPPYIAIKKRNKADKSVLKHEPHSALFGGEDGFFYIKKFLDMAKNFLKSKGAICMEFDSLQKNKIDKLLGDLKYNSWEFGKDQYGKWRYLIIQ